MLVLAENFIFSYTIHVYCFTLGSLGSICCISILHIQRRLAKYLLDPLGLLIADFVISNLGVVLLQVPFAATSSFAGR